SMIVSPRETHYPLDTTEHNSVTCQKLPSARGYSRPLWVNKRHSGTSASCLLYPRKRTFVGAAGMPALCQHQTLAPLFEFNESGSVVCIYIPGNGMISTISIHAPGICRWGWFLPNILAAASCDSACTTE